MTGPIGFTHPVARSRLLTEGWATTFRSADRRDD